MKGLRAAEKGRRLHDRAPAGACALALILGMSLFGGARALAQRPGVGLDITMSNYRFTPSVVHLHRGVTYALTLRNQSGGGHSFEAGAFFAMAELSPADRDRLGPGKIEVPPGDQVIVFVTPTRPGVFHFHCTHAFHSMMGMTGTIVVD
ncbi:MAG TPA: cupredoxin domain-containing protein [Caulobacteraceae bacterium]